jgi:hypothetical protein
MEQTDASRKIHSTPLRSCRRTLASSKPTHWIPRRLDGIANEISDLAAWANKALTMAA